MNDVICTYICREEPSDQKATTATEAKVKISEPAEDPTLKKTESALSKEDKKKRRLSLWGK